jgi:hypothetical protein
VGAALGDGWEVAIGVGAVGGTAEAVAVRVDGVGGAIVDGVGCRVGETQAERRPKRTTTWSKRFTFFMVLIKPSYLKNATLRM